jgi:hypothetical protein
LCKLVFGRPFSKQLFWSRIDVCMADLSWSVVKYFLILQIWCSLNQAHLHSLFTCASRVIFLSKTAPMFLTVSTGVTLAFPTVMACVFIFLRACGFPMMINSVFWSFSLR